MVALPGLAKALDELAFAEFGTSHPRQDRHDVIVWRGDNSCQHGLSQLKIKN